MEDKKEFLEEWKFEDNFEKPINEKRGKKMLNKKKKRDVNKDDINDKIKDKTNEEDMEKLEKEKEHVGVIIGDAAELTDEQKMKCKIFN